MKTLGHRHQLQQRTIPPTLWSSHRLVHWGGGCGGQSLSSHLMRAQWLLTFRWMLTEKDNGERSGRFTERRVECMRGKAA